MGVVVAIYYVVPLRADAALWVTWVRGAAFLAGLVFVVLAVRTAIGRQTPADPSTLPVKGLVLITVLGVALFALADYAVATQWSGQFTDLETRTDALYFAVTTLATVGFGDVHAEGQLARGLLILQITFNLVVLATAVSLLSHRLKNRGGLGAGRDRAAHRPRRHDG